MKKRLSKYLLILLISGTVAYQYLRSDYKHWIDADKDCQDTRQEVLITESLKKVVLDEKGCKVISGRWYYPYTDKYFTNPRDLDIDHFIPLKEVNRSGGYFWDSERKKQYANDLKNPNSLIAVYKGANRSKSDKDPSDWLPPNQNYHCQYIKIWQEIKQKWELLMDEKERKFIDQKNRDCQFDS